VTKRYYKAQIGDRTYFRATERSYGSAQVARFGLTFSKNPPAPGWSPTVEITKAEYDRLQEAKALRQIGDGHAVHNSPQDSWVLTAVGA
jgi:hypothetical protein